MSSLRDGHIGAVEATILVAIYMGSKIFLTFPRDMAKLGATAAWFIPLFSMLVALLIFTFFNRLLLRFPGRNLVQVTETLLGPVAAGVATVIYFLIFFFITVVILRELAEMVKTIIMPMTPISVFIGLFLAAALFAAYQGIESLSRGAWLFFPFILLAFVLIIIGTAPFMRWENITPVLGYGPLPLLKWGLIKVALFGEGFILGLIPPYLRDQKDFSMIGYGSIILSGLTMTLTVFAYLLVFGMPSCIHAGAYPLYQMARLIFYGRFIQRVDVLFIFIWVFSILFTLAFSLYGGAVVLAQYFNLETYRPLLFPVSLLTYAAVFLAPSFPVAEWLDNQLLRTYGAVVVMLPLLLYIVAKGWRLREGGENAA
ncbi:MAG: spore germination protein [Eubacteriales bacterium]|nr:spore germination protein [Eubacteriales bacterium]